MVDQEAAAQAVYRSPNSGAKQKAAGIEKDLIFRRPLLENIVSLTLGGYTFSIE
jgi:hypothetical protein